MTTNRMFRVLILATLLASLVACGGGASSDGGGDAADGGDAAASDSGGAESAAVAIADLKYAPADIEVGAGGSVTWTNDDDAPHTVTFDDDAVTSSEELNKGDEFSATFDTAGSYSYVCAIHPDMKGTVTVS